MYQLKIVFSIYGLHCYKQSISISNKTRHRFTIDEIVQAINKLIQPGRIELLHGQHNLEVTQVFSRFRPALQYILLLKKTYRGEYNLSRTGVNRTERTYYQINDTPDRINVENSGDKKV